MKENPRTGWGAQENTSGALKGSCDVAYPGYWFSGSQFSFTLEPDSVSTELAASVMTRRMVQGHVVLQKLDATTKATTPCVIRDPV